MSNTDNKIGTLRKKRHIRLRKKILGTAIRPRLNVFKSHKHFFVQVINDIEGKTIVSASTLEKELKANLKAKGNISAAKNIGALIAKRALDKGFKKVIFDRGGYSYQGAIKALAQAAREANLEF